MAAAAAKGHSFTDDQVKMYRAQFDAFDEDGGGTIQNAELKSVLQKCGQDPTDAQVAELIREFDSDGNGELDFEEFLVMMWRLQSAPTEKEIRQQMFTFLDDNMDGLVSLEELKLAWKKAAADSNGATAVPSDEVLRSMLLEADADGDGMLGEEDFMRLLDMLA